MDQVVERSGRVTSSPLEQDLRVEQTVVCTLGMHRSGTSVVFRVLNFLGVHFGTEASLLPQNYGNPRGYWEHGAFVEINDLILAAYGGRWDRVPHFPSGWPRAPELAALRRRAEQLLLDEFSDAAMWGWKDPRTCLTLPFWQDLIGPMRYVIPVRNPLAVVASLVQRDQMQPYDAERLWLIHTQAAIAATTGHPRLFVFYEDVMDDLSIELRRMAAFLGVPERADEIDIQAKVNGFIEPALCHHRSTMGELISESAITFPSKNLYLALHAFAHHRGSPGESANRVNEGSESADRALNLIATLSLAAWHEGETQSADRKQLARREAELLQTIARLEAALSETHSSMAWRLVNGYRLWLERVLPEGTRRRRILHACVRRLRLRGVRPA